MCIVVLGLVFFHVSAGRHSDNTTDSRCVPLCVHDDYRAFRAVQAALQTAINRCKYWLSVATSWLIVGTGGTLKLYVVEWIPAAILVQFAH